MKNATLSFVTMMSLLLITVSPSFSQQIQQTSFPHGAPVIVNFTQLAQQELLSPPPVAQPRDVEEDEEIHKGIPKRLIVPKDATVTKITIPDLTIRTQSPPPTITFNGLIDNGQVIPPDVNGAAGLSHLMEVLNSQYRIFSKTGSTVSTLTLSSFWSGLSGSPFSDPHIEFDPINNRWISVIISVLTNNHYGLFIAVSQTSDPTGNWYEYSIDTGSSSTVPDYPLLGFNTNWVVITVNNFSSGIFFTNVKGFILNRSTIYSGSAGTVNTFTDNTGIFTLSAAKTYDNTTTTEYMLARYNGNSGGNGFVKLFSITGSVGSPVYSAMNTIGVNQTWSNTEKDAPQSGSTKLITTNDDRMRDVVYKNGSLWACQTVFLPASNPNRASAQWWQINPSAQTLIQFGRVDDNTGATFYAFPSISVNDNEDVLMGYSVFSSSIFASTGYSYRSSSDPLNTMQTNYTYKSGLSSYYKTFGGTRNRWGDYTSTCVDPVDGSLWTLQEFASSPANNWGTCWANVAASTGGTTCGVPSGLSATSITTSDATLNWNGVSGAISYNIQYKPTASSTWTSTTSTTTSTSLSGLTENTQYEFQVQTVCSSSSGNFSASALFTTLSSVTCTEGFEPNNTKATAQLVSVNTNIISQISSSTDKDWFSFSNTSTQKNIRVTLTSLPANYNLELYKPGGAKIATSANAGTADEQINFNTSTVGAYKVRIFGASGAFSNSQCYTFLATISSTPFKLADDLISETATAAIYPNPTTGNLTVDYTSLNEASVNFYVLDVTGKVMWMKSDYANSGMNTYQLDLNQMNSGVYFLEIKNGNEISHSKFIIER